jgi:chromate reductase, NAD(P)H dehydrogenase (quinone)
VVKILAISGSLRTNSSNTHILRSMMELAPDRIELSMYDGIGDLPHFNPELDDELSIATVRDWRTQLQAADGILFCTPEYAHGVPGSLKNALDWIVASGEFMHKPTAVISASPSPDGGAKANAALVQTLRVMMAAIADDSILCIPAVYNKFNDRAELTDLETEQALTSLLASLVGEIDLQAIS